MAIPKDTPERSSSAPLIPICFLQKKKKKSTGAFRASLSLHVVTPSLQGRAGRLWCLCEGKGSVQGSPPEPGHPLSTPDLAALCAAAGPEHRALSAGPAEQPYGMCRVPVPGQEGAGAGRSRQPVLSGPRSRVNSLCPNARGPNLLQSFCGAGGSNTLAGTGPPPSCYRTRSSRSSFLIKLPGRWLRLKSLQRSQGACEVTSRSHKTWVRALSPGEKTTTLR